MLPTLLLFAQAPKPAPVEATVYSTMPSLWANRPELAMDGDPKTAFRSHNAMADGDAFTVVFARPVPARTLRVLTGAESPGLRLEYSEDGTTFRGAALGGPNYTLKRDGGPVVALRLRMPKGKAAAHLEVREIALDGVAVRALRGTGRAFSDLNGHPELAAWAAKAEAQMASFWPDAAALLYSKGFVPPNAVNVVYEEGKDLPPGMYGGGRMTVSVGWARAHPEDTGLTVHEMAHVVQSGGAPGWLVEAVADYVRWVRFEPENFTYRIDPAKATPHDPYRTGAAFLGWCELNYDPRLVTKLNDATRFGRYSDALFKAYCGKPIDALWAEFLAAYAQDPKAVLTPPTPASMRPRALPAARVSLPVEMPWTLVGVVADGARFRANGGFDDGGAAYAGPALGKTVRANGVTFTLGPVGAANVLVARGQTLRLSGKHGSLWLLGAAIEGAQRDQTVTVTYDDGTTARFEQNFSDWYAFEGFPGEVRAVRMPYRMMATGARDERPFGAYAYGFPLDPAKGLRSVTLPDNPNVRLLAAAVGD